MTDTLQLRVLGDLDIAFNDEPLGARLPRKSAALLVYLACNPGPHTREHLQQLLWGEQLVSGSTNLRVTLTKLRDLMAPCLTITRTIVGIRPECPVWVDALELHAHLSPLMPHLSAQAVLAPNVEQALTQSLALYKGDFLRDFFLPHAARFNLWVTSERARLAALVDLAFTALTQHYLADGRHKEGIEVARRWLRFDGSNEAAARALMRMLHRSQRNNEALNIYDALRRQLWARQHVKPDYETQDLHELILAQEGVAAASLPLPAVALPGIRQSVPNNIPQVVNQIVGRDEDLRVLERHLFSSNCRLLTLTGLGGVGKTHLAQAFARQLVERKEGLELFANGVFMIHLEHAPNADLLANFIARGINLSLDNPQAAAHQLLDFLYDKQMLLIFDNFEHLVQSADLVLEILQRTHGVKVLVTSREPLSFVGERIVEVEGLAYPGPDESSSHIHLYPACRLFVEHAFLNMQGNPNTEEIDAIVRICRTLDGLPLGIQLAAALTRVFGCRYIADAIERNLDLLATSKRNVPERQRSLRAVFDSSWHFLTADEQTSYAQLAVFEDGFTAGAAAAVAQVSSSLLLSLVHRSLVQVLTPPYNMQTHETAKRYRLHPVLHQYSVEALARRADLSVDAREHHADYFSTLIQQLDLVSGDASFASHLHVLRSELHNLRAAWRFAVQAHRFASVEAMVWNLTHFYAFQGPFQEAEDLLHLAVDALEACNPTAEDAECRLRLLAKCYACLALIHNRSANYQGAEGMAGRVLDRASGGADLETQAVAALEAGRADFYLGEFARARQRLEQALAVTQSDSLIHWTIRAQVMLSRVLLYMGDHEQSIAQSTAAVDASRSHGLRVDETRALNQLGISYYYQGRYAAAQSCFDQVLELSQIAGDRATLILTVNSLGAIAQQLGDHTRARIYYNQALSMQAESGDRNAKAKVLANLGLNAYQADDHVSALQYLNEALELAVSLSLQDEIAYILTCLGNALHALHRSQEAIRCLREALVLRQSLGQTQQAMSSLAGLAQIAVSNGDLAEARACADAMLPVITSPSFAIAIEYFRVYWDCYQAMVATNDPRAVLSCSKPAPAWFTAPCRSRTPTCAVPTSPTSPSTVPSWLSTSAVSDSAMHLEGALHMFREILRWIRHTLVHSRHANLARREAVDIGDDIKRPVLDLIVDAAEILANDAQEDELNPAQKEHADQRRGLPGEGTDPGETHNNRDQDAEQADAGQDKAGVCRQLQGHVAETRDRVGGQAHHLAQRVLGGTRIAGRSLIFDRHLFEPDPTAQPAHKAVFLAQRTHGQHDLAVHQAKIAGIERDVDIGNAADRAVEDGGGPQLEQRLAATFRAHSVDDLVAGAPLLNQAQDDFGRILHVGVHHDHGIAVGVVKAGTDRHLVAKVAAEVDRLDPRITLAQVKQHRQRAITAAVVDEYHLPRLTGAGHDLDQALIEHG